VATNDLPFRVQTVKQTADVSLTRFYHPPGAILTDSEEQAADRFEINIVERGAFVLGHQGREWLGCVFLSRPNDVYRYAHLPNIDADTCLSVNLSQTLSNELGEQLRCLPLVPPITNRLRFLQLQLGSIVRDDIDCGWKRSRASSWTPLLKRLQTSGICIGQPNCSGTQKEFTRPDRKWMAIPLVNTRSGACHRKWR
jgi:hypothetical protein